MHIIAYTYEADVHCPACTAKRFTPKDKRYCEPAPYGYNRRVRGIFSGIERIPLDEHYVPVGMSDREGNEIHPVFNIDEDPDGTFTHCGDCHAKL